MYKKSFLLLLFFAHITSTTNSYNEKKTTQNETQRAQIMSLIEECNKLTITVDLINESTELDEWDLAITTIKEWGKELTQVLKEKTPNIKMNVSVSGYGCYKSPEKTN